MLPTRFTSLVPKMKASDFDYIIFDMPPITQDTTRARQELGFEPTSWQEGLRLSFDWYRSQQRPPADFSFDDKVLKALS